MATLYKRRRIFWVGFKRDGRRQYISTKLTDEKAARALLRHYEAIEKADYLKGTPLAGSMKLTAWGDEYRSRRRGRVAPATLQRDREAWNTLIDAIGDCSLDRLSSNDLERWYAKAMEKRRVTTCNVLLRHIKACLNAAVTSGYLHSNPAAHIKPGRECTKPIRTLTRDEVTKLLNYLDDGGYSAWADMVRVALFTGTRAGELCCVKRHDVNLTDRTLTIVSSPQHPTKSKQSRVVPLPGASMALFRRLIDKSAAAGQDHLMVTSKGHPWAVLWLSRGFIHLANRAGVPCKFHDLRRTYGAWLVQAGADLVTVQQNLGHSSIQVTVKHYAFMQMEHRARQVDRLPSL